MLVEVEVRLNFQVQLQLELVLVDQVEEVLVVKLVELLLVLFNLLQEQLIQVAVEVEELEVLYWETLAVQE